MNLRILKKLSKRAAPELEKRGLKCEPAIGDEAIYAPSKLDLKQCDRRLGGKRSIFTSPLSGTPLVWDEYNEWDCKTAYEVLREILFWESPEGEKCLEEMLESL